MLTSEASDDEVVGLLIDLVGRLTESSIAVLEILCKQFLFSPPSLLK
jgi:hypothetical protein